MKDFVFLYMKRCLIITKQLHQITRSIPQLLTYAPFSYAQIYCKEEIPHHVSYFLGHKVSSDVYTIHIDLDPVDTMHDHLSCKSSRIIKY